MWGEQRMTVYGWLLWCHALGTAARNVQLILPLESKAPNYTLILLKYSANDLLVQ